MAAVEIFQNSLQIRADRTSKFRGRRGCKGNPMTTFSMRGDSLGVLFGKRSFNFKARKVELTGVALFLRV